VQVTQVLEHCFHLFDIAHEVFVSRVQVGEETTNGHGVTIRA